VSLSFGNTRHDCDRFVEFLEQQFLHKRQPRAVCTDEAMCDVTDAAEIGSDFFGSVDELCLHRELKMHLGGSVSTSARHTGSEEGRSSYALVKPIIIAAIFVYPIKSCAGMLLLVCRHNFTVITLMDPRGM